MHRAAALVGLVALACDPSGVPDPVARTSPESAAPTAGHTDAELAKLYASAKQRIEAGDLGAGRDLRTIADTARDAHLRANASLLLGSLSEAKGDRRSAIALYRQARRFVPDDPSTSAVLALALSGDEQWAEAVAVQQDLVRMTPDDLRAWLLLGEMMVKGGDLEGSKKAYAGYELRRKGLLDGLTFQRDGTYQLTVGDRVGCVEALEAAVDHGTALALILALETDPAAEVRDAIVETMGIQRLTGYAKALRAYRDSLDPGESRTLVDWALNEIERDPVRSDSGPAPPEAVERATNAGGERSRAPTSPSD